MLEKIVSIKSVGTFGSYGAKGDITFRPLTLIYAENGAGKTTLTAIIRSLSQNDGSYILGRKTLGNSDKMRVDLRVSATTISFESDNWTQTLNGVEVFDDASCVL